MDRKGVGKPSASFYDHFTSLLRVKSNVTDLCRVKRELKLPELQSRNDFPINLVSGDIKSRRRSEISGKVSPSALRSYLLGNTAHE